MRSVLFVCTANVCRSPMAMIIFRDMVATSGAQWRVGSAGTWAIDGFSMAQKTDWVLKQMGHEPGNHKSMSVDRDLLASYNLILTMEQGHKEALKIEFPESANKVYLLSEMIGLSYDIPDPIGKSSQEFIDTYRELTQILRTGFEHIDRLAARNEEVA